MDGTAPQSTEHPVLRWVARIWAELAIVGYLLWQATSPAPVEGEGGYWERLSALAVLTLIVVGHLISWRWEIQGATVMAVGGSVLAVITAQRYQGLAASLAVLAAFVGPAFLYWLLWRRGHPLRRQVLLAGLLGVLVVATTTAAVVAHRIAYGPFHPASTLQPLAPAAVVWEWAGAPTPTSSAVVVRVRNPGSAVRLAVSRDPDLGAPRMIEATARAADAPSLVRFDVGDLDPGTTYHYAAEVDGSLVTERTGVLRTAPTGPSDLTLALGSCLQIGSNGSVLDRIREDRPDLLLFTGDFAYEDFWTDDRDAFRAMYDTQLGTPAMDALVRSTAVGYTWDDHDFGPNDADSTAASGPAAKVVYRQAVPHPVLPAGTGPEAIYQSMTWGRVRIILTDSRSQRSPKASRDDRNKVMLGSSQVRWLRAELEAAKQAGQFVVLVTSVPWNGAPTAGADDWSGYTTQRREVADLIAEAGMSDQLLMVAGDAHMVAIDDGTNTDFSTEGAGGFPLMHAAALDRPGSYKAGPYSVGAHPGAGQYGLVTVDDDGREATVRLSGRDHTGAELMSYEFSVMLGEAPPRGQ
jgi:phosphodiesterase/alkaline phosphatase D-like protein